MTIINNFNVKSWGVYGIKQIIKLSSINSNKLVLQIQYNHIVQAMIYKHLNEELATFLHKIGFENGKRSFKMFTFSRLVGTYKIDKEAGKIIFDNPVSLTVSSPYCEFCKSFANSLLFKQKVVLGETEMEVTQITFENEKVNKDEIMCYTLSPIVVYSTLLRSNGRKYTCYFQPNEPEFDELLTNNLKKKYTAFYNQEPPDGSVKVESLKQPKLSVINYKNTIIKGYSGKFHIFGPQSLLQMGVDTGLGGKNSQGFGCIKVV